MARTQHAPADDAARSPEKDHFRPRLEDMINPRNPLVRVGEAMSWKALIDADADSLPAMSVWAARRHYPPG